jgi:uncharacterized membrane protein YcaP (DUF421 family)
LAFFAGILSCFGFDHAAGFIARPAAGEAQAFPSMDATSNWLVWLLGIGQRPEALDAGQVALRAVLIFVLALALIRVGHKRSLARKTAFDTAFLVMFGAIMARAINGSAPFFPTLAGAAVLVVLHRLLAFVAYHSPAFERLIKGESDLLLRDGEEVREKMRRHKISSRDLAEDLRLRGHASEETIAQARLERSGEISFIPREAVR